MYLQVTGKAPAGLHNLNIFELSPVDACKIKNQPKLITMPVLALVGDFPGSFALNSTQALAANVTGITVSL